MWRRRRRKEERGIGARKEGVLTSYTPLAPPSRTNENTAKGQHKKTFEYLTFEMKRVGFNP